ncbi:MAG: flagellin, partial [bacterium]|nr:flagellin [bacterium]
MRVAHNISAMNAHRNLGMNQRQMQKTLSRLASGFRINSAADDAGGLAISEKLRAQVSGLEVAVSNAQDGISLIQTAEGALDRTHAILRRIRDLTEMSANGDKTDADREHYQAEVDALLEEIDRISATTEYNTKKLLDGTIGSKAVEKSDSDSVNVDSKLVVDGIIRSTGEYKVSVYTAAEKARAIIVGGVTTGVAPSVDAAGGFYTFIGTVAGDYTFKIEQEGEVALATVTAASNAGDSMSEVVAKINEAMVASGIEAKAVYDQTGDSSYTNSYAGLIIESTGFGSKHDIHVEVSKQPAAGNFAESLRNVTSGQAFAIYNSDLTNKTGKLLATTQVGGLAAAAQAVEDIGLMQTVGTGTFAVITRDGTRNIVSISAMITATTDATISDLLGRLEAVTNVSATYDESSGSFTLTDSTTGTGNFQVVNGNDDAYGMADLIGLYRTEYGNEIEGVRISRTQDYMLKVTDPDRNFAYLRANLGDRSSYFASQGTTSAVLSSGVDPDSGGEIASGAGGIAGVSFALEEVQMRGATVAGQSSFSILASAGNLTLQIGPNEGWDHRMTITVDDMSVTGIGLTQELDISTQRAAMAVIDSTLIDQGINRVSKQRGKLGALQNRLEHTIKNLSVTRENLQSSESRIRDADMAAEMMEFTKNQILMQ